MTIVNRVNYFPVKSYPLNWNSQSQTIASLKSASVDKVHFTGRENNDEVNAIKRKLLKDKLVGILEEDKQKGDKRVFLEYTPATVDKIVDLMANDPKEHYLIGISGETASGKTTIPQRILKVINYYEKAKVAILLNADNFYYDITDKIPQYGSLDELKKNYNFDVPQAVDLKHLKQKLGQFANGEKGYIPYYDFPTSSRKDDAIYINPPKFILSEGLFNLGEHEGIKDIFDVKIYVDVPEDEIHRRWWNRAKKRGLDVNIPKQKEVAQNIFDNAMKQSKIYVKPSKVNADVVINGNLDVRDNIIMARKIYKALKDADNEAKQEINNNTTSNLFSKLKVLANNGIDSLNRLFMKFQTNAAD